MLARIFHRERSIDSHIFDVPSCLTGQLCCRVQAVIGVKKCRFVHAVTIRIPLVVVVLGKEDIPQRLDPNKDGV